MRRCVVFMLPLLLSLIAGMPPVAAQTRLPIPCGNGAPCFAAGSTGMAGHIDAVRGLQLPWVASIPAPTGACFIAQVYDADGGGRSVNVSVVAPNGIVFRTGTHEIGNFPFVTVNPTVAGWYTVQFDTVPPGLEQLFFFNFGFLDLNDSYCKQAVTPGR